MGMMDMTAGTLQTIGHVGSGPTLALAFLGHMYLSSASNQSIGHRIGHGHDLGLHRSSSPSSVTARLPQSVQTDDTATSDLSLAVADTRDPLIPILPWRGKHRQS